MYKLRVRFARIATHHITAIEVVLIVLFTTFATTAQVDALPRLLDRSVRIGTSEPGATTDYTISFSFRAAPAVGSVDLNFCINPIPYMPCDAPAGLDVSHAVLASQTGETGWTIVQQSNNRILLSRPPAPVGETPSTFVFTGIVNPTYTDTSFAIRLADYASTDASGTVINPGSVMTQVLDAIRLETQVPPILLFCMAEQVTPDCGEISDNYYTDMGTLGPQETLKAMTQMGVGTNASDGYVITVNGTSLQAGLHTIPTPSTPTPSTLGKAQFGINLRANTAPEIGQDPDGPDDGEPMPNYNVQNQFMFKDGDIVASVPHVSLIRRYTVSYIANAPEDLHAGFYTTTLTFICTGRF